MQPKKKDVSAKTLSDDKELLRETLPALAMPNVDADKLMTELEGLQPKWKEAKKEAKVRFFQFDPEIECCWSCDFRANKPFRNGILLLTLHLYVS